MSRSDTKRPSIDDMLSIVMSLNVSMLVAFASFFLVVPCIAALSSIGSMPATATVGYRSQTQHHHWQHDAFCAPAARGESRGHRCQRCAMESTRPFYRVDSVRMGPGPIVKGNGHTAHEGLLTRRCAIEKLASGIARGVVAAEVGARYGATGKLRQPECAGAADEETQLVEYMSPDKAFALRYPVAFKSFSKPLKTHKLEVNFKSEEVRGYEVGVAVDPVKIESLEKFGTPEEVGARVMRVEQGKDGTLNTKLLGATAEKQGNLSLYTLDYFVESTRGFKHFVAKVTIEDNLLYACTAQAKETDYPQVEQELKRVVGSFRVPA